MKTPETSDGFAYDRCQSLKNMYFYSVPTSPTKLSSTLGYETSEPTTPKPYGDADSLSDEFEFETSHRFDGSSFEIVRDCQQQRQRGVSPSALAFADELFYDGKVVPLMPPLKLPPRLQRVNDMASPNPSLPKSPFRGRKLPRWNSWKEQDFDPFMVALDKVREEKRRKSPNIRRARSLASSPNRPNGSVVYRSKNHSGPIILVQQPESSHQNKQVGMAEPRGLSFGRRLRLVKMGHEGRTKGSGKSKRHKIKEYLFRAPSMNMIINRKEAKKVVPNTSPAQKTIGALVHYRPRLFLCLGYGMKNSAYVS